MKEEGGAMTDAAVHADFVTEEPVLLRKLARLPYVLAL